MTADLVTWLNGALDEDERDARTMAEFYPPPWEVSDRGWMAKVDADEPNFRTVTRIEQWPGQPTGDDAPWLGDMIAHIARWDPARVLAEVAAKRELLAIHGGVHRCPEHLMHDEELCRTLIALVGPYRDRAGFDPSWLD